MRSLKAGGKLIWSQHLISLSPPWKEGAFKCDLTRLGGNTQRKGGQHHCLRH